MKKYLTGHQTREAEDKLIHYGMPIEELMRRAGRALADEVVNALYRIGGERVVVVCGTGNNAGDGYACARELLARGVNVKVYAFNGDMSTSCRRERGCYAGGYTTELSADVIVDCMFGTGLSRELTGEYAEVVNAINCSSAFIIVADISSGLHSDSGVIMGVAVKADLTVALAYPKTGCLLGDGLEYCGGLVVKDIGVIADCQGELLVEDADVAHLFPERRRNTHKGSYGSCCIISGSEQYIGAAGLSIATALRSGCGYIYAVVPQTFKYHMAATYPQCIFISEPNLNADAIVVGMGMGCNEKTYATVCNLLNNYEGKLIIDADGLNALAKFGMQPLKETKASVLLTPHPAEMARLYGSSVEEVLADPIGVTNSFAREYNVTVHLKGAVSLTCGAQGAYITARGNTALAKAGSGDLLSGFICGSAARGLDLVQSAYASQIILGLSAEICAESMFEGCVTAGDLTYNVGVAIKRLTRKN